MSKPNRNDIAIVLAKLENEESADITRAEAANWICDLLTKSMPIDQERDAVASVVDLFLDDPESLRRQQAVRQLCPYPRPPSK